MRKTIPIILVSVVTVLAMFLVYSESNADRLCSQRGGVMNGDMCIIDVSNSEKTMETPNQNLGLESKCKGDGLCLTEKIK